MPPFKSIEFYGSFVSLEEIAKLDLPKVAIFGKSNVGKSTLINLLANQKRLAFTSSSPGHTRLLNFYKVDDSFFLLDTPGYGFSANKDSDYLEYSTLLEGFFEKEKKLVASIILLDSRREISEDDRDLFTLLKEKRSKLLIAFTKCDKLNQSGRSKLRDKIYGSFGPIAEDSLFFISKFDRDSIEKLEGAIVLAVDRSRFNYGS
jgi:GTP-binding protein